MANNKIIYGGQVLIDLTSDTIEASDVINSKTFHGKSGAILTGTCTYDADTSDATASASEILTSETAYVNGAKVTGTMPNNGAQSATLTTAASSKVVPAGYTSGGTVSVSSETKTVTPTESEQTITGTSNKFLTSVTVNPIPDNYGDATNADAVAGNILIGKKAVVSDDGEAVLVTGSMPNNGAVSGTIDGLTTTTYTISAGYTSGGTVSLTSDIENALALI